MPKKRKKSHASTRQHKSRASTRPQASISERMPSTVSPTASGSIERIAPGKQAEYHHEATGTDPASIQRIVQGEQAEYNQQAAGAVASCEAHLVSLDVPMIVLRKLKGILNAIAMQIEDFAMTPAVFIELCHAYTAQVSIFKESYRTPLLQAFQDCEQVILASFSGRLSIEETRAIKASLSPEKSREAL
jgi:hypothetical protein